MKTREYTSISKAVIAFIFLINLITIPGCKKLIEVDLPVDKQTSVAVYANTSSTVSAMTGIYASLANGDLYAAGLSGLSINCALLADELTPNSIFNIKLQEYRNNLNGNDTWGIWDASYRKLLFQINSLIEGVSNSETLPEKQKRVLLGEAKFVRALTYFYLINLYGDVPLVLTTNFKANSNIARSPKSAVYERILKDLNEAELDLPHEFVGTDLHSVTLERVRPNKWAAIALQARVYLYLEQWAKAEERSSLVINNSTFSLPALNDAFLANSPEAIWQLQPNLLFRGGTNTMDGIELLPKIKSAPPFYLISPYLLNAFEMNDNRKSAWITTVTIGGTPYQAAYKYKVGRGNQNQPQTEYTMVLRLAEQYLIRAEARAQQGKTTGANSAESDLNEIRTRAGLPPTTATLQTDMLQAIAKERQVELFTEWGNRWLDLKRTGKLDARMAIVTPNKGGTWAPYKALLPIPATEFKYNPALVGNQNPGYSEQ